jgi:predicted dehydrogenase
MVLEKRTFNQIGENKVTFGVIGSGWRSEFYLRIAKELPNKFQVCGLVTRDEHKGLNIEKTWGVKTYRTIEELLENSNPSFIVVSVAKEVAPNIIIDLANKKIPILAETPPASNMDSLMELNKAIPKDSKIQIAEQYHLQPMHTSRLSIVNSGILGDISEVEVSISHGYHGISLIRKLLNINFENAEINAFSFTAPIIAGPSRKGLPPKETLVEVEQEIAIINFGNKVAIYNFEKDQHRSFIRTNRILVRGNRGEINNNYVKYLKDFQTPIEYSLTRKNAGENENVEGYHLKGIIAANEWVYINPFIPGKLSDEEIAVATCLNKMHIYVNGGASFYSLAEATQDQYLALMIRKSIDRKEKIVTSNQCWTL